MNYERIILELMERIQILEEKVAALEGHSAPSAQPEPEQKSGITARARAYIAAAKSAARAEGKSELILVCNDIQRILDVTNRAPAVCTAMYDMMEPGDKVLFAPPSGKSTTVKILYYL